VLVHDSNQGVGGATITGLRRALEDGADIAVKLDADGQMDPRFLPVLIAPLLSGDADYAKGNRFWDLESLAEMPWVRLAGNAILSFMTKFSTGYWNIFDPPTGTSRSTARPSFFCPRRSVAATFESDLLFRLCGARGGRDAPMPARYGEEVGAWLTWCRFLFKHETWSSGSSIPTSRLQHRLHGSPRRHPHRPRAVVGTAA
jgi:glycosyltransferase involved in cell wall biosynthesis